MSLQFGFSMFLGLKMKELLMARIMQNIEVYTDLKNFVENISKKVSPNVKLDNVQNMFTYFVSFLMLITLVFVIGKVYSKQLQPINRKLVRRSFKRSFKSKKSIVSERGFDSRLLLRPPEIASFHPFPIESSSTPIYWAPKSSWKHRTWISFGAQSGNSSISNFQAGNR